MNGQWIGPYTGSNGGFMVVEIDDIGAAYEAVVYAINNDQPASVGELTIPKGQSEAHARISLFLLERGTGNFFTEEGFKKSFPGLTSAKYADAKFLIKDREITVTWETDVGTHGRALLTKSNADAQSSLTALEKSWDEFKAYAIGLDRARFLFRGQESNRWRLRTAFHRTGRANLAKFMRQDVNALHRHLTGLTTHRFNMQDPLDYAAFLALVQHHGYPTPLLDWTMSPFIAAYFAFRNSRLKDLPSDAKVRIFVFDAVLWNGSFERAGVLSPAFLHLTLLEPYALNNPRVLPQQGYSTVTNIDDLEWYIPSKETDGRRFLTAIDIPVSARPQVLRELELMGINAGSLFPGLDGACNQLRERFFEV